MRILQILLLLLLLLLLCWVYLWWSGGRLWQRYFSFTPLSLFSCFLFFVHVAWRFFNVLVCIDSNSIVSYRIKIYLIIQLKKLLQLKFQFSSESSFSSSCIIICYCCCCCCCWCSLVSRVVWSVVSCVVDLLLLRGLCLKLDILMPIHSLLLQYCTARLEQHNSTQLRLKRKKKNYETSQFGVAKYWI